MDLHYASDGSVYLQDLLERAAVHLLSGNRHCPEVHRITLYLQQMPWLCYVGDEFLRMRSLLLSLS